MNYLGPYSAERQPPLNALLLEPARELPEQRFSVAWPQYPAQIEWPPNVARIEHLPPASHRDFYVSTRWTLNVTRADMIAAGWSPSVRLFEAAACGAPLISDAWPGLEDFFAPDSEICIAKSAAQVRAILCEMTGPERERMALAARRKVLGAHTAAHRAAELEAYLTA